MPGRRKISTDAITGAPNGEKTSLAGTELVPISGSQVTLISTIAAYIRTLTQTLTNKTIDLTSNTLTGTKAQFNTAVSDGNIAFDAFKTIVVSGQSDIVADSDADSLTIAAGSNITLTTNATTDTLTIAASGGGGNSFETIAVSGQSNVVADSATDTLTLVAGSNITITTNAGADSITIAGGAGTSVATDPIFDAKGDLAVGTGADTAAKLTAGANGLFLTTDSTETTGLKWASGGGGVTDAEYLTSAAHASLSNELVIPGLAGSADRAGFGGGGTSEEYDTGTTGLTWNSTPNTVDSDTTIPSHLYVRATTNTEYIGTKAFAPAGAFDARTKLLLGNGVTNSASIGLHVGDSGNSNRLLMNFNSNPSTQNFNLAGYTYTGGTNTQRGSTWNVPGNEIYLRITRDGSNNCSFYFSVNGILWQLVATQSFTFTVANLGYRITQAAALTHECAADWLRTDV